MVGAIGSQITSRTIVYSTVYSGSDQGKHQRSASLACVRGITGEFPAQKASNAENVSIWWRHHETFERLSLNHVMVSHAHLFMQLHTERDPMEQG